MGAPRTRSGRISRGEGKSRGKASGNYSRGIPGVQRGQQQMIIGSDRRLLCNCRDLRENVLEAQQTGKLRTTVGPEASQIQAESGFFFFFFLLVEVEDGETNPAAAAPDTTKGFISLLCLLASPAVIKGTLMLRVCSAYSSVFVCSLVNRILSTCTPQHPPFPPGV